MGPVFSFLLLSIAIVYGLQFIVAPMLNLVILRLKNTPKMVEMPIEQMPLSMQRAFHDVAPVLVASGFVCRLTIVPKIAGGMVKSFATLWVAAESGTMATVDVVTHPMLSTKTSLGFDTQFGNGLKIETSNMKPANIFVPVANRLRCILSGVRDAATLYRIHQARVVHYAPPGAKGIVPKEGEELKHYRDDLQAVLQEQMEAGRLRYSKRSDTYFPTLRGSYAMTWGLIWPISTLRKILRRRRALRELEQIGMNSFPIQIE